MTPLRIQRKREAGWRMPANTVYVGRPSRWGNPFTHAQRFHGIEASLRLYANMARGVWDPTVVAGWPTADGVYEDHREWLQRLGAGHPIDAIRSDLTGRYLACWCALDAPCHADVLLQIIRGEA